MVGDPGCAGSGGWKPGPPGKMKPGGRSDCPRGPIGKAGGPSRWNMTAPCPRSKPPRPECLPTMKPVPKTTATMNTIPATMPTHAATWVSRLCRYGGGGV